MPSDMQGIPTRRQVVTPLYRWSGRAAIRISLFPDILLPGFERPGAKLVWQAYGTDGDAGALDFQIISGGGAAPTVVSILSISPTAGEEWGVYGESIIARRDANTGTITTRAYGRAAAAVVDSVTSLGTGTFPFTNGTMKFRLNTANATQKLELLTIDLIREGTYF